MRFRLLSSNLDHVTVKILLIPLRNTMPYKCQADFVCLLNYLSPKLALVLYCVCVCVCVFSCVFCKLLCLRVLFPNLLLALFLGLRLYAVSFLNAGPGIRFDGSPSCTLEVAIRLRSSQP